MTISIKKIYQFLAKLILPRKFPQNLLFFTDCFSMKFDLRIPVKFDSFFATYQRPCVIIMLQFKIKFRLNFFNSQSATKLVKDTALKGLSDILPTFLSTSPPSLDIGS